MHYSQFTQLSLAKQWTAVTLIVTLLVGTGFLSMFYYSWAQTVSTSSIQTDLNTAISTLQQASSTLNSMQTSVDNAVDGMISTAVSQGLKTSGVSATTLSSPSALNYEVTQQLVGTALNEAVAAGYMTLNSVASGQYLAPEQLDNYVTTAVTQGVSAGKISLSQLTSSQYLVGPDYLVSGAIQEAVTAGTLSLNQIASVSSISDQLNTVVDAAIQEAIGSGINLTAAEQTQILNQALSSLNGLTGPLDVSTLQNTIAQQIVNVTGVGDVTSIVSSLSSGTIAAFQGAVEGALTTSVSTAIMSMSGVVNLSSVESVIANSLVSATGIGDVSAITGAFGAVTNGNFTDLVKDSVISAGVEQLASMTGTVDFTMSGMNLSNSIISATGLGSVSSVWGSMGGVQTVDAFTNMVQGSLVEQATNLLQGYTTQVSVDNIQSLVADSFGTVSGVTNSINSILGGTTIDVTSIATSLTNIDATGITNAIKDSIIQNAMDQISGLTGLTGIDVQNILGSEIMNITGTGALSAITGMINDNIASALVSLVDLQSTLTALTDGVMSQLADLTSLASALTSGVLSGLSLDSLTSLASSLTGLNLDASSLLSGVTSMIPGVSSITSLATNAITSGILSAVDLTSITSLVTDLTGTITGAIGSALGSVTGLTSSIASVSGLGGVIGTRPFGGFSYKVTRCSCTGNYAVFFRDLTVAPPVRLPLIYQPRVTKQYLFYQVTRPGVWILGNWKKGGTCKKYSGYHCRKIPTAGTMTMVGTSM